MGSCLYQKLLIKSYPIHQYMDKESIDWLEKNLNILFNLNDISKYLSKLKKFPINELDINTKIYEEHNCLGIHGIRHQIRVSIYIWIIIHYNNVNIDDNECIQLLQAALYHDLLRQNDNTDLEHGKRSAIWIKKQYPYIKEEIINSIVNHDRLINNITLYDKLIKTADALDRFRLPKKKWWINKDYLLMDIDNNMLEICKYITFMIEKRTYNFKKCDEIVKELKICLKNLNVI